MRAIVIQKRGTPVAEQVQLIEDATKPSAARGEVLIRTEASAMNHLDLWVGRGLPGVDTVYPFTGGSDGCGIVESVGEGVDLGWVGKRVLLNAAVVREQQGRASHHPVGEEITMIGEHSEGTHRAYFTAPAINVVDVGDADPVQAAALGLTHLTAWRMLTTRGRAQAGETVLITGIGGGVALAALALARHLGCRTIVTSRCAQKLERARSLGADEGILDDGSDWSKAVRSATNRRGVDIVIDSIGQAVHLASIKSLAVGGRFVTCGCTTGPAGTTDLARVFWNQLSILGSTMGDMNEFREVIALFIQKKVSPTIDSCKTPAFAQQMFEALESGNQFGKLVFDWRE